MKGISAPPDWWLEVDAAQTKARITSRSQFIRIAVDWYIQSTKELADKVKEQTNA